MGDPRAFLNIPRQEAAKAPACGLTLVGIEYSE